MRSKLWHKDFDDMDEDKEVDLRKRHAFFENNS